MQDKLIVIRGGGDLASGVALRLHRAGFPVLILELEKPLAVRRAVSFCDAVYQGICVIEGVTAHCVSADQIAVSHERGEIPVLADPVANALRNQFITSPRNTIVVDARLLKTPQEPLDVSVFLHIGLGPGFTAGENCHVVIETQRGHTLGRVYWNGCANSDSRQPDGDTRRVLRAPASGRLIPKVEIGSRLEAGQLIAEVQTEEIITEVTSPFKGALRGLIHPQVELKSGMKIGDVDPRDDPALCALISDKALSVGGGVLEAIMTALARKA